MSNLIQIQNGYKSFATKKIFDDVTFAINENEHVGVIGPNGAGKTTLFKVLVEAQELDQGLYIKSKKLRLGYLAQEDDWCVENTLNEYLEKKCSLPLWQLQQLGEKLGLNSEHFSLTLSEMSGGYRMRSQLLSVIGCEPNLMLLDEPTNYLDLESLLVLENFLQTYEGAFLLISHDREFLKRVTDHTLEVEHAKVIKFPGQVDDYFEQKEMIAEQRLKQSLSVEAKRKQITDFVDRFGAKATKAKQAQSKLKQLKKIESIELSPLSVAAKIFIPTPVSTGKIVMTIEQANIGYGDKTVLYNVDLIMNRGDHIGIVGFNGAGKSTLLKAIAGELDLMSGKITYGTRVDIGYFAQHSVEQLGLSDSIYESLAEAAHEDILPQDILDIAGALLFSKDDCEKKLKVLSGGEKTRVALGRILLSKKPVLVFDEPTNHLDFMTVEALTQALVKYQGTLIVVSHDRSFIRRVSTKLIEIDHGNVLLYPGTYDEYVWSVQKGVLKSVKNELNSDKKASNKNKSKKTDSDLKSKSASNKNKNRKLIKDNSKQLKQVESEISKVDQNIKRMTDQLSQSVQSNEFEKLSRSINDYQLFKEQLEERWVGLSEEIDKLSQE